MKFCPCEQKSLIICTGGSAQQLLGLTVEVGPGVVGFGVVGGAMRRLFFVLIHTFSYYPIPARDGVSFRGGVNCCAEGRCLGQSQIRIQEKRSTKTTWKGGA